MSRVVRAIDDFAEDHELFTAIPMVIELAGCEEESVIYQAQNRVARTVMYLELAGNTQRRLSVVMAAWMDGWINGAMYHRERFPRGVR